MSLELQPAHRVHESLKTAMAQGMQAEILAEVVSPLLKLDRNIATLEHNPIEACEALCYLKQELAAKAALTDFPVPADLGFLHSGTQEPLQGKDAHMKLVHMLQDFLRCHTNFNFSLAVVSLFEGHLGARNNVPKKPRPSSVSTSNKHRKLATPNKVWIQKLKRNAALKPLMKHLSLDGAGIFNYLENYVGILTEDETAHLEEKMSEVLLPRVVEYMKTEKGEMARRSHLRTAWLRAIDSLEKTETYEAHPKDVLERLCSLLLTNTKQED